MTQELSERFEVTTVAEKFAPSTGRVRLRHPCYSCLVPKNDSRGGPRFISLHLRRPGRHLFFLGLFSMGFILRMIAWLAYKPAILLLGDTTAYLNAAAGQVQGPSWHPMLYSLLLKPAVWMGSLAFATAIQHVLGLLLAVLLYALLIRVGARPGLAALGTAPLLLDAYQINLEQHILTEALFQSLFVGAIILLTWSIRGSVWMYAAAGALIGLSSVTRFAGLALLPIALIYVAIRRVGWVRASSVGMGFLIIVLGYSVWNHRVTGHFGLTDRGGHVLYGKVATFADCRGVALPEYERQLCINAPVSERAPRYNIWSKKSPLRRMVVPDGVDREEVIGSFTRRFILRQPRDYAVAVLRDFFQFFAWKTPEEQQRVRVTRWQFFVSIDDVKGVAPVFRASRGSPPPGLGVDEEFNVNEGLARFLRSYQGYVYPSGPLLTFMALLGLAGTFIPRRRKTSRDVRPEALLFTLAGLSLFLFPALFANYNFRYVIPSLPVLGPAACLGASVVVDRVLGSKLRLRSEARAAAEEVTA